MKNGSKIIILWRFVHNFEKFMTKLSGKKSKKNDLLQNVSIKNPYYSKFYADSKAKNRFSFQSLYLKVTVMVTLICIWLFLVQKGEGTVKTFLGTVTNKKVTAKI